MSPPARPVHVRISGPDGVATPARVRFSRLDAPGESLAPLGHALPFPVARGELVGGGILIDVPGAPAEAWATISGECEAPLPTLVPLRVQISKGPDFVPVDEIITLAAGQLTLRFPLARSPCAAPPGWAGFDPRAHWFSADEALLEAASEGLGRADVLAKFATVPSFDGRTYPSYPLLSSFSGQSFARELGGTRVAVGTLNRHGALGELALLGTHRVVHPLGAGDDETPGDWQLGDWCDQAHRKNGFVLWVRPFEPGHGGEALPLAVLGKIDGIEYDGRPRKTPILPAWYSLLDAGCFVPLVGASGKDSNRTRLGLPRTIIPLPEPERGDPAAWLNALRSGRGVVSAGPFLDFAAEIVGTRARLTARATSQAAFGRLELVAGGAVAASAPATTIEGGFGASLEVTVDITEASWAAARGGGGGAFAHSGAVWLDGEPGPRRAKAREALLRRLEVGREFARAALPGATDARFWAWTAATAALGRGSRLERPGRN